MRWRDGVLPVLMSRVAVVAPRSALRDVLVRVADAGTMEIDETAPAESRAGPAAQALRRLPADSAVARTAATRPDLDELVTAGRRDLLAGEAELEAYHAEAVTHRDVAALAGWAPAAVVPDLSNRLAEVGATAVSLPLPRGEAPPTAVRTGPLRDAFGPLVRTYGAARYEDVDPTLPAGVAYVLMFGAMFGDLGHGTLLVLGALLARAARPDRRWLGRLASLRPHWLFIAAAGGSAALFGLAYGEFFGPTGLLRPLWLSPMEQPVPLLIGAVGLGALLLASAFVIGTVNRVREGGWPAALYSPSGLAGALLLAAAGAAVAAWLLHGEWRWIGPAVLAAVAVLLLAVGLFARSGGGATGALQAGVELVDVVIRVGANIVSFARLAAFGLTHAVLAGIVWQATSALWHRGPALAVVAVFVFMVGTALAAGLEAVVAGVQALRLEYYELFSRVFLDTGRPFRPWHVPMIPEPTKALPTKEES
jgi:V/A-type H+-transporting ATPase subunit I